jgi:hypothetical protein
VYQAKTRDYLVRKKSGDVAPASQMKHGKTRYGKGCRCDVCRAAVMANQRRKRARRKFAAGNTG